MPIYTKAGDKGETGLPGKRRLSKTDLIFECLGGLDQTNALIGQVVSLIDRKETEFTSDLQQIQSNLLAVGACLAAESPKDAAILASLDEQTAQLERKIDEWDKLLPELKNFILPGGSQAASVAHLARVAVRQTERAFHRPENADQLEPIARYLNRLSDYFFQLARYLNLRANKPDIIWKISD
ncbi:MAG: cob(I)yrinic acid a,c-diamide adenosyltransferase [bacterium]|nr:cob(I)yrinic acid a,c-diamide adenosyltransferase [bacterium]